MCSKLMKHLWLHNLEFSAKNTRVHIFLYENETV